MAKSTRVNWKETRIWRLIYTGTLEQLIQDLHDRRLPAIVEDVKPTGDLIDVTIFATPYGIIEKWALEEGTRVVNFLPESLASR